MLIICDGDMGEGKSCVTSQLARKLSKKTKTHFSYKNNMTFSRKELKEWVDGDKEGKNQKEEYSTILADEIISMFFKRNWYDMEQIDGIELLNKCRDRHLCILGNIPNIWDLDSAIFSIVTFWIHVDERGIAWVFQKDKNPFSIDKWHRRDNEKKYRKSKKPYKCHGFICEIPFDDWSEEEKVRYYSIRNQKRKRTEGQRSRIEKYGNVKRQRDELLRYHFHRSNQIEEGIKQLMLAYPHKLILSLPGDVQKKIRAFKDQLDMTKEKTKTETQKAIADITSLDPSAISYILRGEK